MQKVKRSGQVTIPKDIRERINLNEGDYVQTELQGDSIIIRVLDLHKSFRSVQTA